ncbi:MAG: error-prone DNA polymerase [Planctomycetota bacterium]
MLAPSSPYVPLWCKTNFSFLEGASHPEELAERTAQLGLPALAVTDRDGLYGVVRSHTACAEQGIRLIVGAEIWFDPRPRSAAVDERLAAPLLLLAETRAGYANLCGLLTRGRLRCAKGASRLFLDDILERAEGLVALFAGSGVEAPALREAFGERMFARIARHREAGETASESALRARLRSLRIPTVATREVLYHEPRRRRLQDVLTCIREHRQLHEAGRILRPNTEHALCSPRVFAKQFADDPGAIERTLQVAEMCRFSLDELRYVYPTEALPDGRSSMEWLREQTYAGAQGRYGEHIPDKVRQQLEKELSIIETLEYAGYFLTMREIVLYCRRNGILCQGRGSAANSAVCYCLGITAIDPVRMDLLFERFLSLERQEPPDIDLDIQHDRREEVIQFVYERYGRDHAAMVANVIRFRTRSAIREVGKVLGLAPTALERLAKMSSRSEVSVDEWLTEAGLDPAAPIHRQFVELVDEIRDTPRHLSIHPGGFLLGSEPVHTLVPIENAAMDGRTVVQWDKEDFESLGLFKVDLLALGSLTLCDEAFRLLREHRGLELDLARIPPEDSRTYDMFCRGDTVGVFQIESRAQMAMLPRLQPRTFYDLVVEISIVRPGPISGDMVHPYLRRRHGQEAITYPHQSLVPVLEKTLGVPLFQEQVMKLAVVAADYTPGEADQLRRDMAAWRQAGRIERHRERFLTRMQQKGIRKEFAERVFEQIRGFGEYGFPESHAASFALIAYATGWLRCNHHDVFTCALLNAQPMGFYSVATIVEDARRADLEVRAVDVVHSQRDCTLEPVDRAEPGAPKAIRMGLRFLRGLPEALIGRLEFERSGRSFQSLDDFVHRVRPDRGSLDRLAESGALRELEPTRRDALWEIWARGREVKDQLPMLESGQQPEFAQLDEFESMTWDYQTLGHSTSAHPLESLRAELDRQRFVRAETIAGLPNGRRVQHAGLVICRQRPGTAKGVVFLTLEDETGFCNVVVWPDKAEKFAPLIKAEPLLAVRGKLQVEGVQADRRVVHLVADSVFVPELGCSPSTGGSRDFH